MIKLFLSNLLSFFSFFYFFIYEKNFLKKYSSKNTKIISIGNLSFGGTGKTPMVSLISSILNKKNITNSIISRGYKRLSSGTVVVSDGISLLGNIKNSGDEALVLVKKNKETPLVVGNKKKCCEVINKQFSSKAIIIDDGFQSHYIKKNIEIVLIDTSVPFDDYRLFPLGKLREPVSSLSRADIVVFTKTNFINIEKRDVIDFVLPQINLESQFVFYSEVVTKLFLYKNKSLKVFDFSSVSVPVVCVAGIANNISFFDMVRGFGLDVCGKVFFEDHHNYTADDINFIIKKLGELKVKTIITTLKDFVKLEKMFPEIQIFVVDINHKIKKEGLFVDCLLNKINN